MYKKILYSLLCIVLAIIIITEYPVRCDAEQLYINARAAIVMDSDTKTVLYEKNANMIIPMASTTKIMTALVAIKYGNLDKKIKISKRATSIRGSTVGYKEGEEITIKELLYGLMFRSGNDAAIALAEGIGSDVDGFLKLMNEYAIEIGALNSHFESPHGLDSDNHYCTAYDLALITAKAKENSIFNEIVGAKSVDKNAMGFTRSYNNINKILFQIPEANGVKTGYTGKAGKCLVSSIKIQDHDVIFVVLNCTPRWKETSKMNQYIIKNYTYKKLFSKGDTVAEIKGIHWKNKLKLVASKDITLPCENNKKYTYKIKSPKDIKNNINQGQPVGRIEIYNENKLVYYEPLLAGNTVSKFKLFKLF